MNRVETFEAKCDIANYEQFLFLTKCFPRLIASGAPKNVKHVSASGRGLNPEYIIYGI